jgi:hypothetical protein
MSGRLPEVDSAKSSEGGDPSEASLSRQGLMAVHAVSFAAKVRGKAACARAKVMANDVAEKSRDVAEKCAPPAPSHPRVAPTRS